MQNDKTQTTNLAVGLSHLFEALGTRSSPFRKDPRFSPYVDLGRERYETEKSAGTDFTEAGRIATATVIERYINDHKHD